MTPTFPDEALYTLLCKYLLDEADAEERAWVDEWLQDAGDNRALLASLQKVLTTAAAPSAVTAADTSRSWQQLYDKMELRPEDRKISQEGKAPVEETLMPKRSGVIYTLLKIAAVVLILLGAGWWMLGSKKSADTFAGPLTTTLADGSSITLLGNARLEVANGFNEKNRKVTLSGSATFDVAGNAAYPFVVTAGHTVIKVLGTRFTVRYEPGKSTLAVHVASGKVMVIDHEKADSVVLTENMLLQQDNYHPAFRVAAHVKDADRRALAFHDTPLEEVLHTITEVYDVKVVVEDTSLLKLTVSTNFNGENIDDVINALAMTLNAQWEKAGDRQYKLK
ncbi:FecR family protein [Chitinophaga solisilvae]|uniref:DUF4974 domain-containing protein n=1 Tax=Chitinophaga solisilvae TaxID=1233460 RepID=A0A9Q5D8I2_9BACT|nr:FecR domain-containing protein [Chitinophaga solisilvae]NSL88728.1 DUF4974 domain-containing protein [Chitinophaga solisilvae]